MKEEKTRAGFTLIELVAVLAILGVLAAAAVPITGLAMQRAKEHELRYNLRQVREAIDAYKRAWDEGRIERKAGATGYPPKLATLVDGVEDLRSAKKERIYFIRRIPSDPMAAPGLHGEASWGLRSYASPADEPAAGDDVYDIHSMSEAVGINGLPYRRW